MGSMAYDLIEDERVYRGKAAHILCDARVLRRCEFHGSLLDNMGNVEAAYRLANARISRGEIDLAGRTRRDLTDVIKRVHQQKVCKDDCEECEYALR
jgi:hypothetical protein